MSTHTHENKQIVRRLFDEIWNQGQLAVADEIFARPDSVKAYIGHFRQAFPDIQHTPTDMIAEGDKVVVTWTAKGTQTGQWHNIAPANKPIEYQGTTVVRLKGGKIVDHNTVWDMLIVLEQLDLVSKIRKADGSRL